ncbi:YadA-like family protein [Gallibacterium anatis]|uniref:YadA-like family protein n=1 Tax=Gallibacterium anatis TaxID=750 RepID=UPI0038D37219
MNKVYKVIFDPILGLFKVVSELAKGKGKANKGKKVATFVVLSSLSSIALASYTVGEGVTRNGAGGAIVIGAGDGYRQGDTYDPRAYAGKDNAGSAGNNGTVIGRTAIGWSTGDTAYGAFSNAKGSSVLTKEVTLSDSFDSLTIKDGYGIFYIRPNSDSKLQANTGGDNVALGFKSSAFGLQSVSLGMKSIASGTNALSVGTRSVARDSYSVAIGSESKGMGEASVAMGTFSNALGNYRLNLNIFNDINSDGHSTITQPEQIYSGGSLKDNSSKYQLMPSTLQTGENGSITMASKIIIEKNSPNKEDAALGVKAIALGDRSASIGVKTVANGTAALAVGTESVARTNYTIAQGYQAKAWEEGAIAIGKEAKANAQNAIVLGNGSSNQSQNALVLGNEITLPTGNDNSVVIGYQSTIATNGETRGTSSYDSATIGGLTYGGFTGNPTSVFSIGPSTGRTLQHVAAGKLSATSMDAVNGSQLYRTNLALGNLAKTLVDNLGDNAAVVKTNGDTLGNLTFSNIGNTGQDTVHGAIQKIADSTVTLAGNSGTTTAQNRQTNSSFGIKGAASGGITTTASGSDVSISLDKTTKDTLAKVDQMETKVTQLSSGKADTELSNLTNAGKSVITGLVDVKSSSTALTVSSQTDQTSQKKTFNLALNEDGIKELAGTKTLANDISTAKTEAIKDAKSYTDGKLGNTSLTAVNGNNNTAPTTITQAISQITNAVNSGWEIQQGSTKKGDIGAGKKVNFANGDLTTASVVMSADNNTATVKFNVQTTDLDNDKTTGAVSVTEENKNKLVSAENIANAINKATSSLSSSLAFRGDNNPTVGVDVADDTNTKVDLKKQALKVLGTKGQIKTNATSDGLTISLDSTITDTLTNLENSLGNTSLTTTINGNNAAPSSISEAVNQLTTAVNAGWKLKENGNEKGGVGATEAVDFVNGNNTTATVTAKTANKPATVSFSVNTATLTNDNTTGKITTPTTDDANKLVTAGNLATVVNNAVDPNKLATNVKLSYTSTNGTTAATPAKQVSLSDGLNFKSLNNNLTITAKDDGVVEFQAKDWTDEINTAKTQAISDAQSYTDKKLGDTTTLTSVNGITTAPTSITQAINQITSAVNSGWEIQQGGTKKAEIGAGKKVNFADGNLTTASVEMPNNSDVATVKFDVQTTDLTNDDTGVVSVTNENKNKLVSAGDIAKAINKATSSLSSSLAFRGDNNPTVGVDVANDTNTKVDLKKQALKVLGTKGQIKTNATSDGLTISLDSTITDTLTNLEKASSSAAGNITTIQNLLGNTTPTTTINGNTAAPTTISEAVQQLSTAVNTGWKLKENGDERGGVGATEAVDFVNGSNTTAIVTAKTADKPAAVSFNVNTATLANNDSTGKIIAPEKDDADKLVTAGNLATVVNNAVDPSKLAANVKLSYTSTNDTSTATPAKQVSLSKGLNFKSLNNNLTITAKDDGAVEFEAKDWTDDINTAKAKAISDAQSYTDKKLGDTTTLTSVNGITTAPTSITQAINQITSAVNSGWEIQQGSTKKGDIGAGKKVRFTDGNLTTASVEMPNNSDVATVKFDVQTTNLTSNEATGVVSVTDENKNKLVSAENIANAINKATSSLSSSLAFRGDDNANVKVDATGDTNTKVDLKKQALKVLGTSGYVKTAATGQTLTIDLDSDLKGKLNNLPDNVKKSLQDINDKIGTAPPTTENAKTSPTSSDGLNGKSLTEQIHALRDGLAGNVVYTDPQGNRLVKGSDGEYYPAGTPMGENGLPTDSTQPVDKSTIVATTVNPDGTTTTPTQMGNVKSGLGLDGTGADGTSGSPSDPKAITAEKAKEALNGKDGNPGLLAMEGANNLNKVATVGDLQALAQAGIDFLGNEESTQSIHKTLGSTLNIEGKKDEKYSEANKANYSADNLITHNDNGTLRIEMLKTPTFEGVKLATNGGTPISLTPDANGTSLTLAKNGADGTTAPVELKGIAAGTTDDSAINKGQLDDLKNQLGLSDTQEVSPTDSPAGKDGLDGKTLTEKTNALRDGLAGNVVYTDSNGNRLVKGSDGNYYPAGTQMGDDGLPTDGTQSVDKSTIVATTVNPDGTTTTPTQMGNVKSGLGLDGTGKDGSGSVSDPKAITAEKAKEALNGKDGNPGLLAMEGANNLNKVATVGDLQALAQAGIDFLGNEESTQSIHKTLGSTLNIEGKKDEKYSEANKANYSADNLITHNDNGTLRIEMLKTPTFEGVKLATNGGTPISLAPSEDGSSLTFSKPSDDGSSTMPVELKGVAAGTTENSAINKAQLDELKNQLGLSDTPEVSPTESPAGKDGLDGKTLTEKANALRDGLAGNVVYTDPNGNRLVKGSDGKYYPAEQVGNKVQGTDGKWYPEGTTFKDGNPIAKDGSPATALADTETPKEVAKDSIVSTAVNPDGSTANPIQMGNVKSGLGLDGSAGNNGQDANAADPKAITAEAAKNAIAGADGQSGLLTKSGADLNKVATVGDLQALAQAGLDFNGNNTDAVVHRPLGTKLEIVGDSPATNFASAVGNINVFGDPTNNKLVIQLSKVLTNITSIGGGVKDSVTDKTSTNPEDQKAQLTFNDDDLALNNKTLSGVKSAIKPATETQDKTMLDHLKEAAKDKGSSVVNVEDLAGVTAALETELTDKGLSFGGDSGEKVSRKLGEQLDVKGGVTDPAKLTDNNIGVVTDPDNNALIVKLAKEISDISSITTETKDGQSATFNSAGMTITGSDDKAGQSASYGLGGTTLTNGENKAELKPESLTFSDATNPDGAKSSLSKDSLNFTKEDGSKGISVNGKDGTISNLADRTLVGKDGNGPLSSDYGTGDNRNNAATEGALKDLADKLGVSTPNTLPIDSATGPSGADGLNGTSVLDKIQALRDGTAGNTVYTNEQGERLVKITTPDGSSAYYKAGDLTKDPTTGALTPNPNTTPVLSTNIVISNVNPDGSTTSPTQIANVKSGLGLDGSAGNNGVDGNPANPQAITADAAKKAIAGTDGQSGLLTKSGADLNKVATVGDLQALAQAGLDFVGNNEENVHRPLGTQLKVVGDGVDAAKAKDFESATGNINVKSNATDNSLTVQLAKDLKNLTSSEFKDAEGNTTTVNGAGITITPPAKDDGSVVPSVSLTSKGLDNGGNKITNLAKGEDDGDAVTIAQLKELTQAVTGSSNINIANKEVNKDNKGLDDGTIFEGETSGDVLVQDGKPVLKTYNVSNQKEYLTNSVYTAISNMNEQGIKFFHTNDGKTKQTDQASNTEDSSASGAYATAVGYQSSAEGENSLAMGSGSVVKGENSIVIGSEGSVHGSDSISVGTGNEVFGNNSGAFGDPSIINATSSYLVGNNSTLGSGDELTALVEERKALTRPTRPEKLEAKRKTESDQDYQNRVNDHLEKMMEYNTALADYMEKREVINEKITALSEKTQGVMAMGNNVTVTQGSHGALVMGSNSYVNVVNSGLDTNIQGIAIGNNTRVDTNASSVALGSGAHALQSLEALQAATVYAHEQAVGKGSEVIGEVSFGKEGEYRRLTNVAAGAADTDAVNVSQLKGVASNINQQLNNLSQNISGVAASSAAMANLPQAYLPGKSMVAVSTGYHKGQSAIALGVSRVADNGKLIIKASASHNTQNDFTGGIGVGYQW